MWTLSKCVRQRSIAFYLLNNIQIHRIINQHGTNNCDEQGNLMHLIELASLRRAGIQLQSIARRGQILKGSFDPSSLEGLRTILRGSWLGWAALKVWPFWPCCLCLSHPAGLPHCWTHELIDLRALFKLNFMLCHDQAYSTVHSVQNLQHLFKSLHAPSLERQWLRVIVCIVWVIL